GYWLRPSRPSRRPEACQQLRRLYGAAGAGRRHSAGGQRWSGRIHQAHFPALASVGNQGQRYAVQEALFARPRAACKELAAMLAVFCSPSRYTQGKNATASLGSELLGLGLRGPALLVAGRSARRLLSATWQTTFREARIEQAVHPFGGECSLAE